MDPLGEPRCIEPGSSATFASSYNTICGGSNYCNRVSSNDAGATPRPMEHLFYC